MTFDISNKILPDKWDANRPIRYKISSFLQWLIKEKSNSPSLIPHRLPTVYRVLSTIKRVISIPSIEVRVPVRLCNLSRFFTIPSSSFIIDQTNVLVKIFKAFLNFFSFSYMSGKSRLAKNRRFVPFTIQFQGLTPIPLVSATSNTWLTFSPNIFEGKIAIPLLPYTTEKPNSSHSLIPARIVASGLCAYTIQTLKKLS